MLKTHTFIRYIRHTHIYIIYWLAVATGHMVQCLCGSYGVVWMSSAYMAQGYKGVHRIYGVW